MKALSDEDARALSGLHMRCFIGSEVWSPDEFLSVSGDQVRWGVYAQDDQQNPLALIVMMDSGDDCEILTIGTHPQFRHMGIARYLLQFVEETAHERGAGRCLLEVAADNPAAIGLYVSEGFEQIGKRAAYYQRENGHPTDAIVLSKTIRYE